jgi:hypothetical protein
LGTKTYTNLGAMLGIPKTTPGVSGLLVGFRTHHIVGLMSKTPEKGFKSKSAKGKDSWDEVQRKPGVSFHHPLPGDSQDTLNFPSSKSGQCV